MNKTVQWFVGAVVASVVIAGGYALLKSSPPNNSQGGISAKPITAITQVTVGVMAPLSGDFAVAGENYQKGIMLAKELYEKTHPNMRINMVTEDDGFNAEKGVKAYKKLTSINNVNAIIMLSTPVIDAIYPDVVKTEMPVMQLGIQTKGLAKDNIFQTSPLPEAPIEGLVAFINTRYALRKVAVLYDNTAGGLSFYDAFKKNYAGAHEGLMVNSKNDLQGYATKIATGGYDGVVFLNTPENGALAVKHIITLSKTRPLFIFDAQLQTGFADYKRILGDTKILDGSLSVWLKSGSADAFTGAFQKKYGAEPGFLADFGYDTFNVLINAYHADGKIWQKNIQETKTEGVSGAISFDENGVRMQDIVINEVKEGLIVPKK